jgi:transcription initiation factor IIF auxiliary subunit
MLDFKALNAYLNELDDEVKSLRRGSNSDNRVVFRYKILSHKKDDTGTDWYRVDLFIEPQPGFDLAEVEKVVYVLHETFKPENIIAVKNPANGFLLRIDSWGDFHAVAVVVYNKLKGDVSNLIQYLPIGKEEKAF